jgi:hypothetical protein
LAKLLKIVLDDAANPRGKARAVRREILFKDGSSIKCQLLDGVLDEAIDVPPLLLRASHARVNAALIDR